MEEEKERVLDLLQEKQTSIDELLGQLKTAQDRVKEAEGQREKAVV